MSLTREPVVLFSTADWKSRYWTNKQHMAVHFAARGHSVLYVETPGIRTPSLNGRDIKRMLARLQRGLAPIKEVQSNIWVLSPVTISGAHENPVVRRVYSWQLHWRIANWLHFQQSGPPIFWTYHPYIMEVAEAIDPRSIVYHCVDEISALPGVDGPSFLSSEHKLLLRADHIFATSKVLFDRCATVAPERTRYFANVTDVSHFAVAREEGPLPSDLEAIPRPRIGYVGVLSDFKLNLDLVERTILRNSAWHWVFIGDEREGQASPIIARFKQWPNVHLLGWRPYAALPSYLRGIDVVLLPHQINDYTRAMFPMKFFEYLAAGRPIVATSLPAIAEFRHLYRTADSVEELIKQIEACLQMPQLARVPLDDEVLRTHSWGARIEAMLAIVRAQVRLPSYTSS